MEKPSPAADPSLESRLIEIIGSDVIEPESPLTSQSNLFEEGLDSMAIMQLLVQIEEEFGIQIPMSDVIHDHFVNARAIATLIESKR